jgi:hypothetical protein
MGAFKTFTASVGGAGSIEDLELHLSFATDSGVAAGRAGAAAEARIGFRDMGKNL